MSLLSRTRGPGLPERLEALRTVVDLGRDRLDPGDVDAARDLLQRAGERIGLGAEVTVVALAGSTGSGKSSLFNALSGSELSPVGVRRPTTATAHAAVWGEAATSDRLLEWLGVPRRHHAGDDELDGLVLLDLPDHDSTEVSHRLEVDRLAQLVDVFVWVVDPQKYADAALHEGYLRPLATHADVTVVVLNQIDRLSEEELRRCAADVKRLVESDGLRGITVLSVSARTGEGLAQLRTVVLERVKAERAALERLAADIDALAVTLKGYGGPAAVRPSKRDEASLTAALAEAAGVDVVTSAVARAHRRDAALRMGWPFTRWVRRFRPDPLERLHLRRTAGTGRTSLPIATPLQRARAETAVRAVASEAGARLPEPWPDLVRRRAGEATDELLDGLDRAVGRTDLGEDRHPRWWSFVRSLQTALAATAVVGFLWLTVLFVLEWFGLPRPATPELEAVPWPTILLLGGLAAGFLLAAIAAQLARVGAARRRARADKRLRAEIHGVARERVLDPIQAELDAYDSFRDALTRIQR